jgi:glycosyltransferase involved in cell wall biosynthesis
MHVALFSTYPPSQCGIGTYSSYLRDQLAAEGARVTVLAERTGDDEGREPYVMPCWDRRGDWKSEIIAAVKQVEPEVIHVQHEEAILGQDRRLPELFDALRHMGVRRVVTLHSVYAGGRGWLPGRWPPVRFQRVLGEASDRIVVHQQTGCADRLAEQGVDNVEVIPHGTILQNLPDRATARATLELPADARIALGLGFIHPKKGTHTVVKAFARVAEEVTGARLIIAGRPRRRTPIDTAYHAWLGRLMKPGIRRGWMDYRPGFHDTETVRNLLAAADVLVLPYRQKYGSASGILHTALGGGRAVICARGLKFAEAYDAWGEQTPELFPDPGDVAQWGEALTRVLSDDALRARLAERSRRLGEETSWTVVARRHLELYDAIAGEPL